MSLGVWGDGGRGTAASRNHLRRFWLAMRWEQGWHSQYLRRRLVAEGE